LPHKTNKRLNAHMADWIAREKDLSSLLAQLCNSTAGRLGCWPTLHRTVSAGSCRPRDGIMSLDS